MVFVFELPYHSADAGVEGADLDQHHHKTIGEKGEDDVRRVYHSLIDRHDHLWQADRRVRKQFESSRHDQRPAGSFVEGALKAPRGDQQVSAVASIIKIEITTNVLGMENFLFALFSST